MEHICGRVAEMYLGKIVEMADTPSPFSSPAHPYTRALLSAAPMLDPDTTRHRPPFNANAFDREAPLTQVGLAHWAAV